MIRSRTMYTLTVIVGTVGVLTLFTIGMYAAPLDTLVVFAAIFLLLSPFLAMWASDLHDDEKKPHDDNPDMYLDYVPREREKRDDSV